jgi:hypothetical protein
MGRGITQDEVIKRSPAYGVDRSLRKLEAGEVQPRRKTIIDLLYSALGERDPSLYDELLTLAGYRALSVQERSTLGLSASQPEQPPVSSASRAFRWLWRSIIFAGVLISIPIGWRASGFDWTGSLIYSGLFTVSVMLEAAHELRGRETIEAAAAAAILVLPFSLTALRLDSRGVVAHQHEGLFYALSLIVVAAALQWLAVRPALPSYTIVQTRFQAQTAQAAHLKNTGYFLVLALFFWLPPHHCGEALRLHIEAGFCPSPLALWIALGLLMAGAVPMGSHLLDNLQPGPRHNLYVTLFWTRALLFFLLSALSLLRYSIAGT